MTILQFFVLLFFFNVTLCFLKTKNWLNSEWLTHFTGKKYLFGRIWYEYPAAKWRDLLVSKFWGRFITCIREGNGTPLQYSSCLENPRDGGAWWAAIYGVVQSWTQLKWLSSITCIITVNKYFPCIIDILNYDKIILQ